jgi:hypothetical protein
LLTLPHLDQPLTVATIAFASAIPFLVQGYLAEFSQRERGTGPGTLYLNAVLLVAWILEPLGWGGVAVGVVAVLWHLQPAAVLAILVAAGVVVAATGMGGMAGLLLYAMRKRQMKQERPVATVVDPADPTRDPKHEVG